MDISFEGQVVVITGAARGIGREYALFFGLRGAKVVANNRSTNEESKQLIDEVVEIIKANKGIAVADYNDVINGDQIIMTAIKHFGRIDVLINNAGIIRDSIFAKMSDEDWIQVIKVHLTGTYQTCKTAWKYMQSQNYGRIINTSSGSGFYGQLGQANYSAAKSAIVGLSLSLAKEGEKNNILVNVVAPVAASRMTETIMPADVLENINPANVVPFVALLAHKSCSVNGALYECSGGYIARLRWQRSQGVQFNTPITINNLSEQWEDVNNFDQQNTYPSNSSDILSKLTTNLNFMPLL